jgi:hypothetical protein
MRRSNSASNRVPTFLLTAKYSQAAIVMSAVEPLNSRNQIEVPIAAQKRKAMSTAKGRNPEVIGRNRLSRLSKLDADGCLVMCRLPIDIQHCAVGD